MMCEVFVYMCASYISSLSKVCVRIYVYVFAPDCWFEVPVCGLDPQTASSEPLVDNQPIPLLAFFVLKTSEQLVC